METLPNFLVSCKILYSPNTERQLPAPEMYQLAPKTSERFPRIKTAKNKKKKKMNIKMIISQNVCGLKRHEKKDRFFHHLRRRRPFAVLLQETWLTGDETLESKGYTLICLGLPSEKKSCRGSHGVAIALSPQAMTFWGQSGMEIAQVSSRVIAIRMMISDHQNWENGLILISVYAPISVDSDEAWTSFFADYDTALKMCKLNDTF